MCRVPDPVAHAVFQIYARSHLCSMKFNFADKELRSDRTARTLATRTILVEPTRVAMSEMDVILIIVIVVLVIAFGSPMKWIKTSFIENEWSSSVSKIPGHFSMPVIGTLWVFIAYGYNLERIQDFYKEMFGKFGKIFREEVLFNFPIIHVKDRVDIEKVFKATGKYPYRPPTEVIAYYRRSRPDRYVTVGMVNEQGENWHYLRSNLTAGLISPSTMIKAVPQIEAIADDWCYYIKQKCNSLGTISCVENVASNLALEATCALVLGRRMGFLLPSCEHKLASRLAMAVQEVFRASRDTHFGLPIWKILPTDAYNRLKKGEEESYNIAVELINTADESTRDSPIFQSVIQANVDEREKIAALVDYISAGIFTLSNSMTFLLQFLALNPDVQEKLYENACNNSLTYAKACMNESFRLMPTANPLARIIDEDIVLSGHPVKRGSVVLCHTADACRDADNFYKPDEFIPERWIENDKGYKPAVSSFLVVPFGVGKRICPGKRFIELVMPIVIAQVAKKFQITTKQSMEVQFEFLFSPKGPVEMNFTERQ